MVNSETMARSAETGRVVGAVGGFLEGAAVGSAVIPIPLVGTLVGGVIGSAAGGALGRWVGRTFMNITGVALNAGANLLKPAAAKVSAAAGTVGPGA